MPFTSLIGIPMNKFAFQQVQVLSKRLYSSQTLNISKTAETRISRLANGLRIATEDNGLPTASVGFYVGAGSRFETSSNNGAAHFLEHLAFKGTSNRNQTKLEREVESIGAQLQSSVSREYSCFTANCLSKDLPKVVDILSDITCNLSLEDVLIEQQRSLILKEIEEIEKENQQDVTMDYLHATAYQGTPLGLSVQGPTENIVHLSRDDLNSFKKLFYVPSRMVLAAAGGVDHDSLVNLASQLFSTQPTDESNFPVDFAPPCRFTGSDLRHRNDDMPFVHCAVAIEGVGADHADFYPMMIASQVMGSWDQTSVNGHHFPNPLVRRVANDGLCAMYEAFNQVYYDTSLWGLYYVSDNDHVDDCTVRMIDEMMRLCINLTDFDVSRAKNTLITRMAMQLDGTNAMCDDIGRQILTLGRRVSFQNAAKQIMGIRTEDVRKAVNNYVWDTCPAVAALGPTEAMPHYINMRAKMYKVFH